MIICKGPPSPTLADTEEAHQQLQPNSLYTHLIKTNSFQTDFQLSNHISQPFFKQPIFLFNQPLLKHNKKVTYNQTAIDLPYQGSSASGSQNRSSVCGMRKQRHEKKRIGIYYYNVNRVIGSGYSSVVFKGYKNKIKSVPYAIKVVNTKAMSGPIRELLKNQIDILKKLNHPNILKLQDVIYTNSNCYIITQYCEGGSLKNIIEKQKDLDWMPIINQIIAGCCHFAAHRVIHRDIKPSNIFFKKGLWKIGDFGFACCLNSTDSIVRDKYTIGSPLYMPLETLEHNMYSHKTDSFALGVLIYYLLTREYPWIGNDKKSLIKAYKSYPLNPNTLQGYPKAVSQTVLGLCQIDASKRLYIWQCKLERVQICFEIRGLKKVEQVRLCQFLHYLIMNIQKGSEQILKKRLVSFLSWLVITFQWHLNDSLREFKSAYDSYMCQEYHQPFNQNQLIELKQSLIQSVTLMKTKQKKQLQSNQLNKKGIYKIESSKPRILYSKMLQLLVVVKCIQYGNFNGCAQIIAELELHPSYQYAVPNEDRISQLQGVIDI